MKGINPQTERVLMQLSHAEWAERYILIGGTALSLQIDHRLSEDLDFCKWKRNQADKPQVEVDKIEPDLQKIGILKKNIFDFNQVDYVVEDNVKVSFYANQLYQSPVISASPIAGNIKVPDLVSLGAMKLELMLRRATFRDYYDIYAILNEGISLKEMVMLAGKYTKHQLKSKNILSFILNGDNYKFESEFSQLYPKYQVNHFDIQQFIEKCFHKEYK
ncbi:MAG: nucleotidyl transferase AbiEii/AbiGii toxin family protein [Candidatus Cyclobacteriaceae bacterium M3_2C_046]